MDRSFSVSQTELAPGKFMLVIIPVKARAAKWRFRKNRVHFPEEKVKGFIKVVIPGQWLCTAHRQVLSAVSFREEREGITSVYHRQPDVRNNCTRKRSILLTERKKKPLDALRAPEGERYHYRIRDGGLMLEKCKECLRIRTTLKTLLGTPLPPKHRPPSQSRAKSAFVYLSLA